MRALFLFLLAFTMTTTNANTLWGKKGHRVTGHVAEHYLSKKAKKQIDKLLAGHSLAFVSTYADEIKSDRSYSKYGPWHYVNYPLDVHYHDAEKSDLGDVYTAIEKCKRVLLDNNATEADKVFHLKFLVHLVGDMHQPMHAGRAADKGGNDIQVRWFNEGSNLHKVWDTNLIESYGMSFHELGDELIRTTSKAQKKAIESGAVLDWMEESHSLAAEIYGSVNSGEKLKYSYSYQYNPVMFDRLKKGGIRLAKILNDLFK
ncbi:S1/P1 nuclease [Flavobacterium sp. ASW18X]|uniref:S1/P1 nuclease n=1 Tax=Flavobacterium sp. ASW18X TaxID=2572595 RepID=UPI0010AE4EDC|nr:S1/P1 nuclease [Flavobacterium sp. ASW18X]TKD55688.1 S1/P1 Nuclease [Flavobacterium sp. ASW18X]